MNPTISVKERTKLELDKLKLIPMETYDHVLQRVLKLDKEESVIEQ